jgi:hypothetical protein
MLRNRFADAKMLHEAYVLDQNDPRYGVDLMQLYRDVHDGELERRFRAVLGCFLAIGIDEDGYAPPTYTAQNVLGYVQNLIRSLEAERADASI